MSEHRTSELAATPVRARRTDGRGAARAAGASPPDEEPSERPVRGLAGRRVARR